MTNEPLYQQIISHIKEQIQSGYLRLGDRVPSEKELMDQFHVSQITTKNALNRLAEEGVVRRIKGKGTFIDESELLSSCNIQLNKSKGIIGLILPSMKTRIEQEFVNFIEEYVSKKGFNLMVKITRESQFQETDAIEMFQDAGAIGLIIFPTEKESYNETILRLTLDKFPIVLIDRYLENIRSYSVSSENVKGTMEAISYLLNKDHRHIGLVTPLITNTVTNERVKGFEEAFLQKNLLVDKNSWLILPFNEIGRDKTPALIKEFLQGKPAITAIFTMNAELAQYTYVAINAIKKESDREIELITFDHPGISIPHIRQNIKECSRRTVELLIEQIFNEYKPKRIFIPVTLELDDGDGCI